MLSHAKRSTVENLIIRLILLVITISGLGYFFSLSSSHGVSVSLVRTVRGLFYVDTCNGDPDATQLDVEELVRKLSESRGEARLRIIRQLGSGTNAHWANQAVDPLLGLLKDTHNKAEYRGEAAQSLINLAGYARGVIPSMLQCLGDDVGEIRQQAVCFLVSQGQIMKQPLLQQLHSTDNRRFASAATALSYYPTVSLQPVAARLEALAFHHDPVIRAQIARALGQVQSSVAQQHLRKLLTDNDPEVRREAVGSLGQFKMLQCQQLLAILYPVMQDRDALVRKTVVRVLCQYQDAGVAKALEAMLHKEVDIEAKQMISRTLDHMLRSHRSSTQ